VQPAHGDRRGTALSAAPWRDLLVGEELAHLATEAAVVGREEALPGDLEESVRRSLEAMGITSLYDHQLQVWESVRAGRHVIIATGTASGKSLAFNLPVLQAAAVDSAARALYLYPTKALAQDQARALSGLGSALLRPAVYDGDTPPDRRRHMRREATALLTNPDMLHVGILPHHDRWGELLHNLRFVVVDEAHVYRGVFGSHVGNVLRRLRRIALSYGSEPRFLLASATVANAGELATALTGLEFEVVAADGAPRAGRDIALWNPPLLDAELGTRASALAEASRLLAALVARGLRTICFTKSRKAAEVIHRLASARVDAATASRLRPYRAGYTAAQRREIERQLVAGELLGVTATDALELGIDVGGLDCSISVGFPGTVASLRQQWGRAGRRTHGLGVLIASDDALDQYFMRDAEALLSRRVEAARLDHSSPRILDAHVCAAAYEGPLTIADEPVLGKAALARAATLPELAETPAGWVWQGRDAPAARVSLRSGDQESIAIVDGSDGAVVGTIDRTRAHATVHTGAVYLHLGEQYVVRDLDLDSRTAVVAREDVDWYTQAKNESATEIGATHRVRNACGVALSLGGVSVTEQVVGYQRKALADGSTLETVPLELPAVTFETEAIWFSPDGDLLRGIGEMPRLLGALHAAEHTLIALLPLWAMCDRWDLGGLSTNIHPQTQQPTIFVFDGHAGGVGIAERGFDCFEGWLGDTSRLLHGCPCSDGCPSCVQSPKCGNLNEMLDKRAARTLLARMAGAST
jgi:DEAD/DEAH box helicase domain-containing protein